MTKIAYTGSLFYMGLEGTYKLSEVCKICGKSFERDEIVRFAEIDGEHIDICETCWEDLKREEGVEIVGY